MLSTYPGVPIIQRKLDLCECEKDQIGEEFPY